MMKTMLTVHRRLVNISVASHLGPARILSKLGLLEESFHVSFKKGRWITFCIKDKI